MVSEKLVVNQLIKLLVIEEYVFNLDLVIVVGKFVFDVL